MGKFKLSLSRRKFLKQSAAFGVGALITRHTSRDALAASRDRVTIYHNTVADSIHHKVPDDAAAISDRHCVANIVVRHHLNFDEGLRTEISRCGITGRRC